MDKPFNILSPGEIEAGMYVIVFEVTIDATIRLAQGNPLGAFFGNSETFFEEAPQRKLIVRQPWLAGIPFYVSGVGLPLVMVTNLVAATIEKPLPETVFYDTRMVSFVQVNEDYAAQYKKYADLMRQCNVPMHNWNVPKGTDGKPLNEIIVKREDSN